MAQQEVSLHAMCLNHPESIPVTLVHENCLPRNWRLVPKRLETTGLEHHPDAPRLWVGPPNQDTYKNPPVNTQISGTTN